MTSRAVTIAVDVMGGDDAPSVVVEGIAAALAADPDLLIAAVGPAGVTRPLLSARCTTHVATEVIGMDEHAASAVRSKKDSSIVVGCRLVKDGAAQGFFSAGSTGACMAAATLNIGRARGVTRPAIAAIIPAVARPTVLLDVGANADVKPEMLVQFAAMGSAYAQIVLGVESPSVGLLNIGQESTKGSLLAQEAHRMLVDAVPAFVGNIEGRDVAAGVVDVIVTDGFTGNVALKVLEGLSSALFRELRTALNSSVPNKLAGAVVAPSLQALRKRLDPDAYGGAPLLGLDGVCIIGHGSSGPTAIANGIAVAARAVRGQLPALIARALEPETPSGA